VRTQDLAHALARDAEAQRDLVEAVADLAQRSHLLDALLRARRRDGADRRLAGHWRSAQVSARGVGDQYIRVT